MGNSRGCGWFYEQFPVLDGDDIDAVNALIKQTPWGGRLSEPPA